jgi:hypothetical protein
LECKTGCEHCRFTIATNRMQGALLPLLILKV